MLYLRTKKHCYFVSIIFDIIFYYTTKMFVVQIYNCNAKGIYPKRVYKVKFFGCGLKVGVNFYFFYHRLKRFLEFNVF